METRQTPPEVGIPAQKAESRHPLRNKMLEVARFDIHNPTVEGRDRLPPPETPCVIATTHLSDVDVMAIASEMSRDRDIGIASQRSNFDLFGPFINLAGKDTFYPIENKVHGIKSSYRLTSEDMNRMTDAITQKKKTMVIAAHNPTFNWQLPDKPGLGAVIEAHEAGVPLIPVALDIDSPTPVGVSSDFRGRLKNLALGRRPHAKIVVGEAVPLSELSHEQIQSAMDLYSMEKRRGMTPEQVNQAKEVLGVLQDEGNQMMMNLASMIAPEKRGKWGNPPAEK